MYCGTDCRDEVEVEVGLRLALIDPAEQPSWHATAESAAGWIVKAVFAHGGLLVGRFFSYDSMRD